MKIYRYVKLYSRIKSPRLKLLGLWAMHLFRRRYLCVFMDPVLTCNLRCKMCYFSDPDHGRELGRLSKEEISNVSRALFRRVLKLQIGCGAEPTLYSELPSLVRTAKHYGVPYVSLTTNGVLLGRDKLETLAEAGLNEITISCHGVTRETYEELMVGGRFERFRELLEAVKAVKKIHSSLKVRVNYTMNADNTAELVGFFNLFDSVPLDILQLRPIQQIGNTAYQNFSHERIAELMDSVVWPLVNECTRRGITCLAPSVSHLETLNEAPPDSDKAFKEFVYCNWSSLCCWKSDFDPVRDTFESYCRRRHVGFRILKAVFTPNGRYGGRDKGRTRALNYDVN